jgi:hypothetical protein
MTCEEARRVIGAEPNTSSRELPEHVQGCAACAEFQLEMLALDANIRRALEEPPVGTRFRRRVTSRPRWALAASVLVGILGVLVVWALRVENSLAHEVVAHVIEEPQSWTPTDPASQAEVAEVLRKSGLLLEAAPYEVMYARSCWFRGHFVPHLVVRTAHGLATVLILRDENIGTRETFHEDGLFGVLVPSAHGSIAVLAADGAQLDDLAARMQIAVRPMGNAAAAG